MAEEEQAGRNRRRNPVEDGPRLFKRGRWWAADLRPWGGKRPTLRDPKKTVRGDRTEFRDTARKWAEEYISRLQTNTHRKQLGIRLGKPLQQAVEEYLTQRRLHWAAKTVHNDDAVLRQLEAAFGSSRLLHSIDEAELQDWFDRLAVTRQPSTLALYAVLIKSFFDWAEHPISRPKTPVQHAADPDTLEDGEVESLLDACRTEVESQLAVLGLATGGRKAELWGLDWGDFKSDYRSVRFSRQLAWPGTGTKGLKGKRARTALILPGFISRLKKHRKGRVFSMQPSEDQASVLFRELLKRAGLYRTQRGMHILRHTYARIGMEQYAWSTEMLRIFLGHRSITSVECYAHFGEQAALTLATQRTYKP